MLKEFKKDNKDAVREFKANTSLAMQQINGELTKVNTKFDNHLSTLGADLAKKNKLLIGGLFILIVFILIPDESKLAALKAILSALTGLF